MTEIKGFKPKLAGEWKVKFVEAVVSRRASDVLVHHFDDLILWLNQKPVSLTLELNKLIEMHGMGVEHARMRTLKLLDTKLAASPDPWHQLGLTHSADQKKVKQRYKRLMQLYHPDKALGNTEWLTERVTRIRKAYERIVEARYNYSQYTVERIPNPDRAMSAEWQEIATANRKRAGALRSTPNRTPSMSARMRRVLGDSTLFKKRMVLILVSLTVVYAVLIAQSLFSQKNAQATVAKSAALETWRATN